MKKFLLVIKVSLILSFAVIIVYTLQNKKYIKKDNINEVYNTKKYNIEILYERVGIEKGIYKFNTLQSKNEKIYNLLSENIYLDNDLVMFYKEKLGIYISREVKKYDELVFQGFTPIGKGKRFNDEIVFIAYNKEVEKVFCKYNLLTKKTETKRINIQKGEVIDDISFIDKSSFLYTKKINSENFLSTKVYSYNINKDENLELTKPNILSPISSNNKMKTAYIKKDASMYNLYIYNNSLKKDRKIPLESGIVKGSIAFSPNDKYIICITLNNDYESVLNVIDLDKDEIYSIENIYEAIFSDDGENIVVSSYDSDKNMQYIDMVNIKNRERSNLYSFSESGNFSKSINLIKANMP